MPIVKPIKFLIDSSSRHWKKFQNCYIPCSNHHCFYQGFTASFIDRFPHFSDTHTVRPWKFEMICLSNLNFRICEIRPCLSKAKTEKNYPNWKKPRPNQIKFCIILLKTWALNIQIRTIFDFWVPYWKLAKKYYILNIYLVFILLHRSNRKSN